jgi:hypothetical protein
MPNAMLERDQPILPPRRDAVDRRAKHDKIRVWQRLGAIIGDPNVKDLADRLVDPPGVPPDALKRLVVVIDQPDLAVAQVHRERKQVADKRAPKRGAQTNNDDL